jgi:hypothetical protein
MVLGLIAGRTIVGYHTKIKLHDLGIEHRMSLEDMLRIVNCSTMFNSNGKTDPQHSMKELCQEHLNIKDYSRSFPFSVSEFNKTDLFRRLKLGSAWPSTELSNHFRILLVNQVSIAQY